MVTSFANVRYIRDDRPRHGEAVLRVGDLGVVLRHGHVGDDLGAGVGEVDDVQGRGLVHRQGVLIGDLHLHGSLRLHLVAIVLDLDVKEAREGHGLAGNAQLRRGILKIPTIVGFLGQYLADLELGPVGDFGLRARVQRDLEGIAVEGRVERLEGVAEHVLGELFGGEGEARDILHAVVVRLAGQRQRVGDVRRHAILDLVQLEVSTDQVLFQVHRHLEALIRLGVHVLHADADDLIGRGLVRGLVLLLHGGDRFVLLSGLGDLCVDGFVLGQVQVVHGRDDRDLILGDELRDARGGQVDAVVPAVRHADRQVYRAFRLLEGAQGPFALRLGEVQDLLVRHADRLDARVERRVGGDLQRGQDIRQRHVLRAADVIGIVLYIEVVSRRVGDDEGRAAGRGEREARQRVVRVVFKRRVLHLLGSAVRHVVQLGGHIVHHRALHACGHRRVKGDGHAEQAVRVAGDRFLIHRDVQAEVVRPGEHPALRAGGVGHGPVRVGGRFRAFQTKVGRGSLHDRRVGSAHRALSRARLRLLFTVGQGRIGIVRRVRVVRRVGIVRRVRVVRRVGIVHHVGVVAVYSVIVVFFGVFVSFGVRVGVIVFVGIVRHVGVGAVFSVIIVVFGVFVGFSVRVGVVVCVGIFRHVGVVAVFSVIVVFFGVFVGFGVRVGVIVFVGIVRHVGIVAVFSVIVVVFGVFVGVFVSFGVRVGVGTFPGIRVGVFISVFLRLPLVRSLVSSGFLFRGFVRIIIFSSAGARGAGFHCGREALCSVRVLLLVAGQAALIAGLRVGVPRVDGLFLGGPIARLAGQRLDLEGHAVDHHGLALRADQLALRLIAAFAVLVRSRADLLATGQLAGDGVTAFAVLVRPRARLLAAGQLAGDGVTRIPMLVRPRAHLHVAGQHVLIAGVRVLVRLAFLLVAYQRPGVAGIGVHVSVVLRDLADQVDAVGIASVRVLVSLALGQLAGQHAALGIAGVRVLVSLALRYIADQGLFIGVAAIRVLVRLALLKSADQLARLVPTVFIVLVVVFLFHDPAYQFAVPVAAFVRMHVRLERAHVDLHGLGPRVARLLPADEDVFITVFGVRVLRKSADQHALPGLLRQRLRQHGYQVCRHQQQQGKRERPNAPRQSPIPQIGHEHSPFPLHSCPNLLKYVIFDMKESINRENPRKTSVRQNGDSSLFLHPELSDFGLFYTIAGWRAS